MTTRAGERSLLEQSLVVPRTRHAGPQRGGLGPGCLDEEGGFPLGALRWAWLELRDERLRGEGEASLGVLAAAVG